MLTVMSDPPFPDVAPLEPLPTHQLPGLWPPDYTDRGLATPLPEEESLSSVHPPETKLPEAERQTEWGAYVTSDDPPVIFRHSGWAGSRRKVRAAMVANYAHVRPLSRFDLCGSEPWVAIDENDSSRFAIVTNHCHSRWCVPCARERSTRIVGNLRLQLNQGTIRFLTLTLKHSDAPLSKQIDRLYASFRKLRRAAFWSAAVEGGAAVLEIGHSWKDDRWHPHLHCLLQGKYLRHADLKAEWWRITGDSNIVDIRPCQTADNAARYITKYITKPIPNTIINKPEPLAELLSACHGRRLVLTWGSWRGLKLTAKLDTTAWKSLCPLTVLYERRDAGDLEAFTTILALERQLPEARTMAGRGPPDEIPFETKQLEDHAATTTTAPRQ